MLTLIVKILLIVGGVIGLIILILFAGIKHRFATKQSDREVAEGVSISTDWIEIIPKPPLRATKRVQDLIIMVEGTIEVFKTLGIIYFFPMAQQRILKCRSWMKAGRLISFTPLCSSPTA